MQNTIIAREIRDLGVYSEIHPHDITAEELTAFSNVRGIILNNGENRVVDGQEVQARPELYELGHPIIFVDYPQSKCAVKLVGFPNRETLKKFLFEDCKAEVNWKMWPLRSRREILSAASLFVSLRKRQESRREMMISFWKRRSRYS